MKRGSSVSEQFGRTVGTFAALGPLTGTAVVGFTLIVLTALSDGASPPSPGDVIGFTGLALVFGYVFGIVPAALTGFICHVFARAIPSATGWILACAATGAACTALAGVIVSLGVIRGFDGLLIGLASAVPGGVAAAVCAFTLRQSRWR